MNERLILYAAVALVVYAAMRGGGSGLFGLPQPVPMAPALDDLGGLSVYDNPAALQSVLNVRMSGQAGGFV